MTAASNSEARKRRAAAADPVEIVARAEFDATGPWFSGGFLVTWDDLHLRENDAYRARRIHAGRIVAALRDAGLLNP